MRRDPVGDDDDDKLIPEWDADADDQIMWVGLVVFAAAFLLLFGWGRWFGGDDSPAEVAVDAVEGATGGGSDADLEPSIAIAAPAAAAVTTTTEAPTTTTTAAPTTLPPGPQIGDVEAAVAPFPGSIDPALDGTDVTLTGFVADAVEEVDAVDAAAAVDGVETVTSELVLLEPAVAQVLADQGVVVATVDGVGTEITITGTLQTESDREPTITAAAAVEGVTSIIDRLQVSVADELNALPTIPFATGSSTILPEGQTIVDDAAALITSAGEVAFEVQGYTDITGDDQINQELSESRAAAVVDALIAAGVDAGTLTAIGFGETEQFATGTSAEALAANRVVRFVQTG